MARPARFERWLKAFGAQCLRWRSKIPSFTRFGDVVFSRSHVYAVARVSNQAVDWPLLQFFRMRGAKILELRPFHWDTAAMLPALNR